MQNAPRVLSQVIKSFDLFKAPRTFNALQIVLQLTACTANKFAILWQPLLLLFLLLLLLLSSNLPCFLWLNSRNKVTRLDKVLQAAKQTPFPTTFPPNPLPDPPSTYPFLQRLSFFVCLLFIVEQKLKCKMRKFFARQHRKLLIICKNKKKEKE